MPDQDAPEAGAGSPPCDCCCPDACPCGYCFYPAFDPPLKGQFLNGQTGEVIAEGVVSVNPETGQWVVNLEPPADTPAVVEGP